MADRNTENILKWTPLSAIRKNKVGPSLRENVILKQAIHTTSDVQCSSSIHPEITNSDEDEEEDARLELFLEKDEEERNKRLGKHDEAFHPTNMPSHRATLKHTLQGFSLLGVPYKKKQSTTTDNMEDMKLGFFKRGLWNLLQPTDNKLSMKLFGSKKGIQRETDRLKAAGFFIIHPCSKFRFYWDLLIILLLLSNLIILPVVISFFHDGDLSVGWVIFNCFSDTLFCLDVVFNFRTGIMDKNTAEQVILHPAKIAVNYLKTWFLLDVIASFPFDYVYLLFDDTDSNIFDVSRALKILRLFKLLSLLRLLRLSRLLRFMRQWEQVFNVASAVIRMTKLVFMMLLIGHWNGCMQFLIPMLQEYPPDSWVSISQLVDAPFWNQYSWALFKAMSHMLCIGFGRFPPQNLTDLWLTMVSMISGATCFALFIGHATTLIQTVDSPSRQYREKVKQVEEYMAYRKLPKSMRENIKDFYEHRYHGKMFDEEVIFGEISQPLREGIANYNCRELVASVPFFMDADSKFVTRVVTVLKFEVFQPGDVIIQEGTLGDRMFFIQQGIVDVITRDGEIATSLSDGSFFGEICLLTDEQRVASVLAETYCTTYSLSVDKFRAILKEYPAMGRTMHQIALKRLDKIGRSTSFLRAKLNTYVSDDEVMFPIPDNRSEASAYGLPALPSASQKATFDSSMTDEDGVEGVLNVHHSYSTEDETHMV